MPSRLVTVGPFLGGFGKVEDVDAVGVELGTRAAALADLGELADAGRHVPGRG